MKNVETGRPVVVLGAGMAGLAAARIIAEAGQAVLVLEARDRVGGRIHTVSGALGKPIELGAEFIHGRSPELWALIAEAGLQTYERTGSFLIHHGGQMHERDWHGDDAEQEPLERLKTYTGPDLSFSSFVDTLKLEPAEREQQIRYVEGFNAADARQASALALGRQQAAEDAIEGERVWKIRGGYRQLPDYLAAKVLAAGGRIELNAPVTAVQSARGGGFQILYGKGLQVEAAHVIVALPLGVLQAETVSLPPAALEAIRTVKGLRMGPVCRITLQFKRRLWPERMSFLLTPGLSPAVWWTDHPADDRTLTGWSGGPRSLDLLALPADQIRQQAIEALSDVLDIPTASLAELVEATHFFDWQADPLSRGAYSWVAAGGLEDSAHLSLPLSFATPGRLFFAGEHTDTTGLWGTVHAAYGSGLRAGRGVLQAISETEPAT